MTLSELPVSATFSDLQEVGVFRNVSALANRSCGTRVRENYSLWELRDWGSSTAAPGKRTDLAFSKTVVLRWCVEDGSLQFRAEFFNALNHTRFVSPTPTGTWLTFGVMGSTAVNPRVGQLALRLSF